MVRLRRIGGMKPTSSTSWKVWQIIALIALLCCCSVYGEEWINPYLPALITSDPDLLKEIEFDHIIVGAGLAGMVMASRLSEDRSKKVLLIEAGNDTRTHPLVRTVRLDNDELQVKWKSRPQIGGKTTIHSFGIGLGGSTSINGAKVDAPPSSQIDALRKFGNPSWNWNDVLHYMKKSQNYHPPEKIAMELGATFDQDGHGIQGPLDITFSPQSYTGEPQKVFIESLNETLGIDRIIDSGAGEPLGYSFCPHFIKFGTNITRESSATAYLSPIEYERSNLFILTGWRGIHVNWEENEEKKASESEPAKASITSWATSWQKPFSFGGVGEGSKSNDKSSLRANGITVQSKPDGPTFELNLKKDDVNSQLTISTGALVTPLLLELSGVGDPEILSKIGVETKINLPGVGRNLVDKPTNILATTTKGLHRLGVTGDPLPAVAMISIDKLYSSNKEKIKEIEKYLRSQIKTWSSEIVKSGGAVNLAGIENQFEIMLEGIFKQDWPVIEWEYFSKNLIAIKTFVLQPFSRGFIHSLSKNSVWNLEGNDVDLHGQIWSKSFDLDLQVASMNTARKFLNSPKMKTLWEEETKPGLMNFTPELLENQDQTTTTTNTTISSNSTPIINSTTSNQNNSDNQKSHYSIWKEYILDTYDLICHNFGTASMMKRELGGVIDEDFKVYGTKNLRIVDASIFPLQFSAHPSLAIFGVAEKAADVIGNNHHQE